MHRDARRKEDDEREAGDERGQTGDGHRGPEHALLRRGGHHLRARRLARGQRRLQGVAAGQRRRHLQRRRRALLRLALNATLKHALDERVQVFNQIGRRGRHRKALAQLKQLRQRLGLEGAPAREDFVEDEAERVDVASDRQLLAFELFGGHVGGRAGPHAVAEFFRERGQPEVREADVAVLVNHHVGGLEVSVQHAALVHGVQARAQLPPNLHRLVGRQPPETLQDRGQLLAAHELHRKEVLPLGLADVVDAADVSVRHLPREAHLLVEARERRAVARDALGQELQRDRLLELQVVRAVDLAHAAATQEADDAVAPGEHRPRDEARVVNRGGRGGGVQGVQGRAAAAARVRAAFGGRRGAGLFEQARGRERLLR
ncbi:MAG TPA: hypothetical protein VGV38_17130, partial [Pyrinomonadaceae bacterium]|nr:hypothetical protein [Pyrinomonadaceae bacterium]